MMKITQEIAQILVVFLVVSSLTSAQTNDTELERIRAIPIDCNESGREKLDQVVVKFISLGENGRPFPTNEQELPVYCSHSVAMIDKLNDYVKKCYTDDIRSLAKVIVFSVKSIERQFCRSKLSNGSKKMKALVAATPCINKYARSNSTCPDNYTRDLEQIINLPRSKNNLKVPHMCCQYTQMLKCIDLNLGNSPHECLVRQKDTVHEFIASIFKAIVDIMCGGYNDLEGRCTTLPPMPNVALPPGRKVYHSQMFALIDVMLSIEDEKKFLNLPKNL